MKMRHQITCLLFVSLHCVVLCASRRKTFDNVDSLHKKSTVLKVPRALDEDYDACKARTLQV